MDNERDGLISSHVHDGAEPQAPRPGLGEVASDVSLFDMFQKGPGPSSSHTVGPMKAGRHFSETLNKYGFEPSRIKVDLYGSLASTGLGHGTNRAVILGLEGAKPESVTASQIDDVLPHLAADPHLVLPGGHKVPFEPSADIIFDPDITLPFHTNALRITAYRGAGRTNEDAALTRTYYSMGGGSVAVQIGDGEPELLGKGSKPPEVPPPHMFSSGQQLLDVCAKTGLSISRVARQNEESKHSAREIQDYIHEVTQVMFQAVEAGSSTGGVLPGGLGVLRRAMVTRDRLLSAPPDPLSLLDWVTMYALAVNEQNAAGHQVVTAPTNGSAGVLPAVLGYYMVSEAAKYEGDFRAIHSDYLWQLGALRDAYPQVEEGVERIMLTALAIGAIIKTNASVAGAEVGCQGEIGSACAMAAAGLTEALGGTPMQVENAAEIAMEHHLGLTCDPVAGLVQIPCIERNAMGAVKAISASRLALSGDGTHTVSLDVVIKTMRQTGQDMLAKYRETSAGGLAVNVVEC